MTAPAQDSIEFSYLPPRLVAPEIWELAGDWKNKLGRRMTVIRLKDHRLVLHSSIRLHPKDLDWLRSLGSPAIIIAPNSFHTSDAGWMAHRFPAAELFVPASKFTEFREKGFRPKDVNSEFPQAISSELECIPIEGTRISEAAFLHHPTRTLILCDLAFNMADVFTGLERVLMRWNRVGGRFGPSRLTKLIFAKDRAQLLNSYRKLLTLDFDRVIVNHGDVLESGGHALLRAGVDEIFGEA